VKAEAEAAGVRRLQSPSSLLARCLPSPRTCPRRIRRSYPSTTEAFATRSSACALTSSCLCARMSAACSSLTLGRHFSVGPAQRSASRSRRRATPRCAAPHSQSRQRFCAALRSDAGRPSAIAQHGCPRLGQDERRRRRRLSRSCGSSSRTWQRRRRRCRRSCSRPERGRAGRRRRLRSGETHWQLDVSVFFVEVEQARKPAFKLCEPLLKARAIQVCRRSAQHLVVRLEKHRIALS